jgi:apolipoprotein N-acyltransferase
LTVFAINLGFGYWRMSAPPESSLRVALVESDDTIGKIQADDETAALKAIDAYAAAARPLAAHHVQLVVFPENISRLAPTWRDEAEARLAALSQQLGATLVAGFNTPLDGALRNVSLAFTPGQSKPVVYLKRRLVPVLETKWYTPGSGPRALENGVGLEVCKDMDFHAMLRADMAAIHPKLLAVPAWDYDRDDWSHARVAILRSVENGVPLARSARDGLLTLNDRYGRLVTRVRTVGGFSVAVGDLPLDGRGGDTVYDRIGDVFGWGALLATLGLLAASLLPRRRRPDAQAERDASG